MIDSHCHLYLCKEDPLLVLQRAKELGVSDVVQVATDIDSYKWGLDLKSNHELDLGFHLTAGLYPSRAEKEWKIQFEQLDEIYRSGKVVAVGEIGLDLYHTDEYIDEQVVMFEAQVELALEHNLPMILHIRNSYSLMWQTLQKYKGHQNLRGVWHCFDGSLEEAQEMISLGFEISLAGIVTYKNAKALQEVVTKLPREHLMIETDSPYLAPMPKRGKKNEPGYVSYTLDFLADLLSEDRETLESTFTDNTRNLFKI